MKIASVVYGFLGEQGLSPAAWGFFGIVATGLLAILAEQIRSRHKTEAVRQEVIDGKDSNNEALTALTKEVQEVRQHLSDHIKWHLESRHRW